MHMCVCEYACVGGREGSFLTSTQNGLEDVDGKQPADIPAQCVPNYVVAGRAQLNTGGEENPEGLGSGSRAN